MNSRDLLAGAGIGAALTFMLDPDRGRRRRALVRDQMMRATRLTREGLDATARDISNRTRGIAAATGSRFSDDEASDAVLVERVRAKLGRVCSHPRALDVMARNGEITLRGPILADEAVSVMSYVASVRGVVNVVNELDVRQSADGVPSLQGQGRVAEWGLDIMQRHWAPATRALVGASVVATGVCLAAYARRSWSDRQHAYAA
jgi:hypothetical protein